MLAAAARAAKQQLDALTATVERLAAAPSLPMKLLDDRLHQALLANQLSKTLDTLRRKL